MPIIVAADFAGVMHSSGAKRQRQDFSQAWRAHRMGLLPRRVAYHSALLGSATPLRPFAVPFYLMPEDERRLCDGE
jgi:hypothetical protein